MIDRVINAKEKVATAVAGCDVSGLETYIRQIEGLKNPHPKMANWVALMRERLPRCKTKQVDNANADCRKTNTAGYRASIQADGSYYCVPDKETADAACSSRSEGWAVRKISLTGQIDCFPKTEAAQNKQCKAKFGDTASAKGWKDERNCNACSRRRRGTPCGERNRGIGNHAPSIPTRTTTPPWPARSSAFSSRASSTRGVRAGRRPWRSRACIVTTISTDSITAAATSASFACAQRSCSARRRQRLWRRLHRPDRA